MVAFKVQQFGGMIPAQDDRLLPDNQAANATNTWLYNGDLQGVNTLTFLRACVGTNIGKAFRIPNSNPNSFNIANSIWLEFQNPDTDVIRTPVIGDTFNRYYWAASNIAPSYNTLQRIQASSAPFLLGIPTPGGVIVSAVDSTAPPTRIGATHSTNIIDGLNTTGDLQVGDTVTGVTGMGVVTAPPTTIEAILTNNAIQVNQATTASSSGTLTFGTNGLTISRAYTCTWVSAYGEESAPGTPAVVNAPNTFVWNITLPTPDPLDLGTNRNIASVNIYRTVTSSAGVANYFLVDNVDISTTTYADSATDAVVSANVILPSTTWTPPPADLQGITKMPNGIVAGFRDNEIWFCEPYRPHAWPAAYTLVVDFPVVGLGVIDQNLVVCTEVYPIVITGSTPASMTQTNMSALEPCLSRASILSTIEGVYYVSPNGLVLVNYNGANLITKDLIRKDKWQNLVPTQVFRAARLQNGYYGFGLQFLPCFNPLAFNPLAFNSSVDNTYAFTGVLIDTTVPRVAFNQMTSANPVANVYNDVFTGEVFIIQNNNVYWLNVADPSPTLSPYTWLSKKFQFNETKSLGAMRLYFTVPPNTPAQNMARNTSFPQTTLGSGQYGIVSVYADDVLVMSREIWTSGELMRIPSGFKGNFWQVKVNAIIQVNSLQVAASAKELASV